MVKINNNDLSELVGLLKNESEDARQASEDCYLLDYTLANMKLTKRVLKWRGVTGQLDIVLTDGENGTQYIDMLFRWELLGYFAHILEAGKD